MISIRLCVSYDDLAFEVLGLMNREFYNDGFEFEIQRIDWRTPPKTHHDIYIIDYQLVKKRSFSIDFLKSISDSIILFMIDMTESPDPLLPLNPFNYIRKPLEHDNFIFLMKCAYGKAMNEKSRHYPCHINGGTTYIDLSIMKYFFSYHRKVTAKSIYGLEIAFYLKLDDLERDLREYKNFIRINKSFLINQNYIEKFNHSSLTIDGETFSISRRLKEKVLSALQQYG